MNIYRLTQHSVKNAGTFDSMIVIDCCIPAAINWHPTWLWDKSVWASSPCAVEAELIGVAAEGLKRGIICRSYMPNDWSGPEPLRREKK